MLETLALDSVVASAPVQVAAQKGGDEILLNPGTGQYYRLNGVGAWIWSFLKHPCSIASIHEAMLEEYDVEPEECLRDLVALMRDMLDAKLIVIRDE